MVAMNEATMAGPLPFPNGLTEQHYQQSQNQSVNGGGSASVSASASPIPIQYGGPLSSANGTVPPANYSSYGVATAAPNSYSRPGSHQQTASPAIPHPHPHVNGHPQSRPSSSQSHTSLPSHYAFTSHAPHLPPIQAPALGSYFPHSQNSPALEGSMMGMPKPQKLKILDPPSAAARSPTSGYGLSPVNGTSDPSDNPKFSNDCAMLNRAVQQAIPDAVRRIVRDNWEKCLLGTDYHLAFVMNATIHHAKGDIVKRAIRDFGSTMVPAAKFDIIAHLSPADIDEVADAILAKAGNRFLDKALEKRLHTIEARPLLNALARAERLGYDAGDIVEDPEHVIPRGPPTGVPQAPPRSVQVREQPPPAAPSKRPDPLQCDLCLKIFTQHSTYDHHMKKSVCTRQPPSGAGFKCSCHHCGQGFTNIVGLQYHVAHKVCGDFGEMVPTKANRKASLGQPSAVTQPVQKVSHEAPPTSQHSSASNKTPTANRAAPHGAYSSPASAAKDTAAHLTTGQKRAMEEELKAAEEMFSARMAEARRLPNPTATEQKLVSLKNSFATKQSMIRKKYGIRLRERRSRTQIEEERLRMAGKAPTPSRDSGGDHADKRARKNGAGESVTTQSSQAETPNRKGVAVSQMGGGLSGVAATAATADPTAGIWHQNPRPSQVRSSPPQQPSSTQAYQQGDLRVQVHLPSPSKPVRSAAPAAVTPGTNGAIAPVADVGGGSESQPLTIRDDSDSNSDSDGGGGGDIPAELPPLAKTSQSPA